jgi:hypothetical protein
MTMMNDLTQGGGGDDIPIYRSNAPPPRGPAGAPTGIGGSLMIFFLNTKI